MSRFAWATAQPALAASVLLVAASAAGPSLSAADRLPGGPARGGRARRPRAHVYAGDTARGEPPDRHAPGARRRDSGRRARAPPERGEGRRPPQCGSAAPEPCDRGPNAARLGFAEICPRTHRALTGLSGASEAAVVPSRYRHRPERSPPMRRKPTIRAVPRRPQPRPPSSPPRPPPSRSAPPTSTTSRSRSSPTPSERGRGPPAASGTTPACPRRSR
jgi:hypothetical protein